MTHEFKSIVEQAKKWQKEGITSVLATVVDLEGSSYRRPGVQMLLNENGSAVGAVSGGCVEKEVHYQAQSVFKDQKPKMMTYDGTLRLGCEGIIYVLLEPFEVSEEFLNAFEDALGKRSSMSIEASYKKEFGVFEGIGSTIVIENQSYVFNQSSIVEQRHLLFKQELPPLFQLLIIGAEHDAVQLCKAAANVGWKVSVMASADEQKTLEYFTGADELLTPLYDTIDTSVIDKQTAIVLMTHSFNKDVQYLSALKDCYPAYFGLLGPKHRRERLVDQLLEFNPEIDLEFIDQLRGPAGINIGAESPQEIAVSIIAEILSVIRNQNPIVLKDKEGNIHA
jgi:xanthine/CO dehydrogenase XdhC/CoxF family maturation factor